MRQVVPHGSEGSVSGETGETVTIPVAEYELLTRVYLHSLTIRDAGVQQFNRLPAEMRLAVTTLAMLYRSYGFGDDGLPKAEQVRAMFDLARGGQ